MIRKCLRLNTNIKKLVIFGCLTILYLYMNIEPKMSDDTLPTLYQYYTSNGIKTGLSDKQTNFTLNNKEISIYSGAIHYFRVPPQYWRDRLRKLRACGLNTVETYVPWNLHEPQTGAYDFGNGNTEFEQFLDIAKFIRIAQEEDLFVIVRPGPYICAEWEFGGLPSWLLRYDTKIRTSDPKFIQFVRNYYKELLKILEPLQFSKNGAIIAFQIENEYGNTKTDGESIDTQYLNEIKTILQENGIVELLFTSETPSNGFWGTLPNVLATANFQEEPEKELKLLQDFQPGKPLMVMEYWTGWFDHWSEKHHTRGAQQFVDVLEKIIQLNSSFNMYMFHGGTNWGLLNGANIKGLTTNNADYQPDITSYDYDAPLTEAGDYTDKYFKVKHLMEKYSQVKFRQPTLPTLVPRVAYETIQIAQQLTMNDLIEQINYQSSRSLLSMEKLNINNDSGQSYGYIIYRKEYLNVKKNAVLTIHGHVCDTILVLINGKLISKQLETRDDLNGFGFWRKNDSTLVFTQDYNDVTLDLVVENYGRVNYGKLYQFKQFKGLWQGNVTIDDVVLNDWKIYPMEFKKNWTNNLSGWKRADFPAGPALYKGVLNISEPIDTFVDMRGWNKGIVIVNGFVLARYLYLGPQQTVYLPAPFLKTGPNDILIFEHYQPQKCIRFNTDLIFEEVN